MSSFFKGTLLLVLTAFIGECLEFLINMVIAKELGELGMGQYMSILPFIILVVIIASFEMPISISKFVAEKEPKYHRHMLSYAMRLAILLTIVLMLGATLLFTILPIYGEQHPSIRWIVLILIPIISFSSIARGYFMGIQHMGKIAFANLLRRMGQLLLLVFVFRFFQFHVETSVLIALCALIGSELIVFVYFIHAYILQMRQLRKTDSVSLPSKSIHSNLMAVSIPMTGMRIFHAVSNTIEPFLIKSALVASGLTMTVATEKFGVLAGVAMTIGFFPAFIAHSLLTILIPTVSEAYANKNQTRLVQLLKKVMVITFIYGIPVCFVFYYFGDYITKLFFESTTATYYLQLLWPFFLLHYFIIPLQAFLIGLGLVKDAFIHSILSTIISFAMMYLLGSTTQFQMAGIIIGMNAGAALLTALHYTTVCKKIGISITLKRHSPILYD